MGTGLFETLACEKDWWEPTGPFISCLPALQPSRCVHTGLTQDKRPYADNVLEQRGEPWEVVQVAVFLFKPQSQVCSSASSF